WRMQVSNDRNPANYIFSSPSFNYPNGTNFNSGQAIHVNFTGLLATNHISGHLQDGNGSSIGNVQVNANATIGGVAFQTGATTDGSGNYSIAVVNGVWSINVSCQGGDQSLDSALGSGNYI